MLVQNSNKKQISEREMKIKDNKEQSGKNTRKADGTKKLNKKC